MTDGPAFSNRRMILKWVELRGPLSAVWKTAIAFPNQPNSKSTIPTQPTTGWTGAAGGGPAGPGFGAEPHLKEIFHFLIDPSAAHEAQAALGDSFPNLPRRRHRDSILHCRSSSILARRMRSANSVSLADFAICSKASQLNPGRRTAPPSLSDFSFS